MDFKARKFYNLWGELRKYDIPVLFAGDEIETAMKIKNSEKKGILTKVVNKKDILRLRILTIIDFKLKINALLNGYKHGLKELLENNDNKKIFNPVENNLTWLYL